MSVSTKYWFIALIYMGLIFIASSIPGDVLPETGIFWGDKFIHLVEFGILSWILGKAFRTSGNKVFVRQAVVLSVMLTILYGISDEIHQFFVSLRSPDIYDVVADGLGAILAQGIFLIRKGSGFRVQSSGVKKKKGGKGGRNIYNIRLNA